VSKLRAIPPSPSGDQGPPSVDELGAIGPVPANYVERNRAVWEQWALEHAVAARKAWAEGELRWGLWDAPELELALVADVPQGADIVELGCGTAAISAALGRMGMRPVAVDFSRRQLDLAARLQRELGPSFPLIDANAEEIPYENESFDLALSDYGASLWCEPRRWLAEAHRLLRPRGRLVFVVNSPMLMACTPDDGSRAGGVLVRDSFASPVFEFAAEGAVEFHLNHGDWVRTLGAFGFTIDRLLEVRPPPRAKARYDLASIEWARRWPSEDIWVASKTS
jgi:SAM-dependent methyltransferase